MEKAYRDYGHDIDNTDNLAMVGLGFAVAKDKPAPWIGRGPTLAALAAAPPQSRLVQVLLADPEPLLFHAEILLRDGVPVGDVRSGSYGWTLGGAVGLAMVPTPTARRARTGSRPALGRSTSRARGMPRTSRCARSMTRRAPGSTPDRAATPVPGNASAPLPAGFRWPGGGQGEP